MFDWLKRLLTRLNNRKQLTYHYEQWKSDEPAYILMIDANKFKQINDTYGHIQGDAALVRIADALRIACSNLPKRANIARYGGDEFVVFAGGATGEQIADLCEHIRAELKRLNKADNSPYDLTVSIGVAVVRQGIALKDAICAIWCDCWCVKPESLVDGSDRGRPFGCDRDSSISDWPWMSRYR